MKTQPASSSPSDLLREANRLRLDGRPDEAARLCRRILESHPRYVPALNFLALVLSGQGAFDEAEALLRRATSVEPADASLHNNLGNVLRRRGQLAAAEQSYRAALAIKADYPEAHHNLGIALRELKRPGEAFQEHKTAALLKPDYVEALTQIASLLAEGGAYADALPVVDAAIGFNAKSFEAHYTRSAILTALERPEEAIDALNIASGLEPNRHEPYFALGNAYLAINQNEAALEAYAKAIQAAPDFLPAHYNLNTLAWSLGKGDSDLASFAFARTKVGDKPELLLAEGELRLQRGEFEAAAAVLEKAHRAMPERADIASAFGRASRALGRIDESVRVFQNAVMHQPASLKLRQDLAVSYIQAAEFSLARSELEQAFLLAPFHQLTLAYLTLVYRVLGDGRYGTLTDFEKFVRVYDLPVPRGYVDSVAFHRALAEDLAGLHTQRVAPLDQTLRGGTQTTGFLFAQKSRAIGLARERINEAVAQYIRDLPDIPGHPATSRKSDSFSFSGAWSCRLNSAGFHTNHVHPEGWISSAYYVSLPDAIDDEAQKSGWLTFGESNLYLGDADQREMTVKPAIGKLVLFPSYLWHGTVPFESDTARLAIAFDVVPGQTRQAMPEARKA